MSIDAGRNPAAQCEGPTEVSVVRGSMVLECEEYPARNGE